ncbi:hypothetical protein [Streptomyces sp. NBC_01618]|uniref:hypothetical protein n=1 Tax=Streptomyces sp. NBC_01618 TaxID=2975900 RepID=UPI0038672CCE|nr:hypothetical protein OH735_31585 [Streptomyces sp. NBC_01618]
MNAQNPMHVAPPTPTAAPQVAAPASLVAAAARPVASADASATPAWTLRSSTKPAELPAASQELAGPFLREYRPVWPYRHRSAQVVAVLYYRNRPPRAVGPEGEEGFLLRWLTRPYTAFELQLGWHTVSFKAQLPAAEAGRSFPAEVRVRWQVDDPCLVARSQVSDVATLLLPELEQRLRDVSRTFSIRHAERVRDAVHEALSGQRLGGRFGLELDVFVTISSDQLIQDHGESLGRDESKRELIEGWARDFQRALEADDDAMMARMIAGNPKDQQAIRQMFRKEQRDERQDVMEVMSRLIDGGLLERWELGEQAMVVVEFLRQNARRVASDPMPLTQGAQSRRSVFWEEVGGSGKEVGGSESGSAVSADGSGDRGDEGDGDRG